MTTEVSWTETSYSALNETSRPPTSPSFPVVRNEAERALFITYIFICGLISIVGNSCVLYLVVKNHFLHQPRFYIIGSYAVSDIALSLIVCPMFLLVLFGKGLEVSDMACSVHGSLMMIVTFVQIHMLGYLASERFVFFCHPLRYPRLFTTFRTFLIVALSWAFSVIFAVPVQTVSGRRLFVTVLSCQVSKAILVLQIQIGCYILPTFLVVSYCTIRIASLIRTHQVAPSIRHVTPYGTSSSDQTPAPPHQAQSSEEKSVPKMRRKAKAAIRVIMLTSGAFYATYIPYIILRWVVFMELEASWPVVESGKYLWMTLSIRFGNTTMQVLPSALNALIYFYTHKSLRRAFVKTFFKNRIAHASDQTDLSL